MAHSVQAAEQIADILRQEGILVRTHAVYRTRSQEENYYEIKVLDSEAAEARAILLERNVL